MVVVVVRGDGKDKARRGENKNEARREQVRTTEN
jgi:hypothetical protein